MLSVSTSAALGLAPKK